MDDNNSGLQEELLQIFVTPQELNYFVFYLEAADGILSSDLEFFHHQLCTG
jgi:hypothetical protein